MNTPQFDWVKSRLPNRAQPVPPVFQPEVIADAVVRAAESGRREVYVGFPTVGAIVGDKVASGLLDRYLAATGVAAQQTDEPEDPDRANNLWSPVPGDRGAHGRFDAIAYETTALGWLSRHAGRITAAASLALVAAGIVGMASRSRSRIGARAS
jgi:hypothetical protein